MCYERTDFEILMDRIQGLEDKTEEMSKLVEGMMRCGNTARWQGDPSPNLSTMTTRPQEGMR